MNKFHLLHLLPIHLSFVSLSVHQDVWCFHVGAKDSRFSLLALCGCVVSQVLAEVIGYRSCRLALDRASLSTDAFDALIALFNQLLLVCSGVHSCFW